MTGTGRGGEGGAGPATRRQRLRDGLAADGVPALLVTSLTNVRYLTGFTGSNGTLLVRADADADVLVTDGRYADQAAAEVDVGEIVVDRGDGWLPGRTKGLETLGVEGGQLPWNRVRQLRDLVANVELVDAGGRVERLRERKDDDELERIRRACAITADAVEAMFGWLAPALTERQAAHRLLGEMLERGADERAFDFIVASGPNGARPHHQPTERRLAAGDLVTFDVGARVDGYRADMTRTVALGDPGEELRAIYELVRTAQQAGLDAVGDGVAVADVDAACRQVIAAADRGDQFVHPTGHGLGLDVHEQPILTGSPPSGVATLRSRMAVTVEPGVYVPGLGGVRIEDVVVVTDGAGDVLTSTPKDLVVL